MQDDQESHRSCSPVGGIAKSGDVSMNLCPFGLQSIFRIQATFELEQFKNLHQQEVEADYINPEPTNPKNTGFELTFEFQLLFLIIIIIN